jgi:hypothetical protein
MGVDFDVVFILGIVGLGGVFWGVIMPCPLHDGD